MLDKLDQENTNVIDFPTPKKLEKNFDDPGSKARLNAYRKGKKYIHFNHAETLIKEIKQTIPNIQNSTFELMKDVLEISQKIELNAQYLQEIKTSNEKGIPALNPVYYQHFLPIERKIIQHLWDLNSNIDCLIHISDKYGYVSNPGSDKDVGLAKESYCRLTYIRRFLNDNMQFSELIFERTEFIEDHLKRLIDYLHRLPTICIVYVDNICKSITALVPGIDADKLLFL